VTERSALERNQAFYDSKAELYDYGLNQVVLRAVQACLPPGGRVLDVGCGSGGLLAALAGHAAHRAGVELSAAAAAAAAQVADEVVNLPVDAALPFPAGSFDVVVCADVLEHLAEPAATLTSLAALCRPGGAVVVSVPNVANWQARMRLVRGVWRYEPVGLFDSGHLRFFTKATLLELITSCGLVVDACVPARQPVLGVQLPGVARLPTPLRQLLPKGWGVVAYRMSLLWPGLFAYQLVCTSRRPAAAPAAGPQPDGSESASA
jgi:methionine biosynthesis protein MetW